MSTAVAAFLDGPRLAQAREALNREIPTPSEGSKFYWLIGSVWAAVWLMPNWLFVAFFWPAAQWPFLIAMLLSIVMSAVLVFVNVPYLIKLFRAYRMARRLGFSQRLTAPGAGTRGLAAMSTWLGLGLPFLGYPLALLAMLLIAAGIQERNPQTVAVMSVLLLFAVACVLIRPVTRMQQRLLAVTALKVALERRTAGVDSADLSPALYDDVTDVERVHIEIERKRFVTTGQSRRGSGFAVRMSGQFQEATMALPVEQAAQVFRVVHGLATRFQGRDSFRASDRDSALVAVPATPFEVEFRWNPERREIGILELKARGAGEPHDG